MLLSKNKKKMYTPVNPNSIQMMNVEACDIETQSVTNVLLIIMFPSENMLYLSKDWSRSVGSVSASYAGSPEIDPSMFPLLQI